MVDSTPREPVTDQPVTDQPVTDQPVTDESVTGDAVAAGWVAVGGRRLGASPVTRRDLVLAVVAAAAAVVGLAVSDEPPARAGDALGYGLLVLGALPILVATSRPLVALVGVTAATLAYFALAYPGGPVTPLPLAALYVAAETGRRAWALGVVVLFAGVGSLFRLLVDGDQLVEVLLNSALFVLVLLLGDVVYSRRALRAEVRERLRRAAEDQARETRQRLVRERMHIARELHDVMAHTVATMTVQAGAAADALDDEPEQARRALRHIRAAARDATAELRATISVLREDGDGRPPPPAPRLDQLADVVAAVQRGGLAVEVVTHGTARALPAAVDVTAYRIVQEALTNVVRHAGATAVRVSVTYAPSAVELAVEDDGRGPTGVPPSGYGLRGLRERVEALGGALETARGQAGGYRLAARLPVPEQPA